jgi:hypothetical protein
VQLANLAARDRIPAAYSQRDYTAAGGLMSYGTNQTDTWRQVGVYIGNILKGAKPAELPAELPVQQAVKFDFVINRGTATLLGIEVPPQLLRHDSESLGNGMERTVALIGDSLSTTFNVSSLPRILVRARRGWRTNWFLSLPVDGDQANQSVLMKLSCLGTVSGANHASVSAMVDDGKPRSFRDHLFGTYHFSHQVDEVLMGRFPDILLLWIGHNSVGRKWQADAWTDELSTELSDVFARRYEVQLHRLLDAALGKNSRSAIVVFGLINFGSFFRVTEAEAMRSADHSLFPHLESAYRHFASMKPEYRDGMVKLAMLLNDKLESMCKKIGEQLLDTNVRLVYSSVLSVMIMDNTTFINSIDWWSASIFWHSRLANRAFPIIFDQARLLGWATE